MTQRAEAEWLGATPSARSHFLRPKKKIGSEPNFLPGRP